MKSEKILASQRATIHRYVTYPRADLNLDGTIWAQAPGRPEHTRLGRLIGHNKDRLLPFY